MARICKKHGHEISLELGTARFREGRLLRCKRCGAEADQRYRDRQGEAYRTRRRNRAAAKVIHRDSYREVIRRSGHAAFQCKVPALSGVLRKFDGEVSQGAWVAVKIFVPDSFALRVQQERHAG
jgi:hypothetical protein